MIMDFACDEMAHHQKCNCTTASYIVLKYAEVSNIFRSEYVAVALDDVDIKLSVLCIA